MHTYLKQCMEALDSFFNDNTGDVVEYMESMLYDWYQHYAQEHYSQEHIDNIVNGAFRVNELLLRLAEARSDGEQDHRLQGEPEPGEQIDYLFAG